MYLTAIYALRKIYALPSRKLQEVWALYEDQSTWSPLKYSFHYIYNLHNSYFVMFANFVIFGFRILYILFGVSIFVDSLSAHLLGPPRWGNQMVAASRPAHTARDAQQKHDLGHAFVLGVLVTVRTYR